MTAFRILRWGSEELPPVVCLHDVRGHARRYERLARVLEPGRLVVAYDLRGHGRSPWSGPHSIEQHADDLDEVMDACEIDQAGLIGDGLGARIAIAYAIRNQERINSLTLLEPPIAPVPAEMHRRARREDGLEHTPRALLEEEMAEHLVADEDGLFRYRYSREAAAEGLDELAQPETRLGELLCPTMVIRAEQSRWVSDSDIESIGDAVRRLRIEEVPGGHELLWDALAETSALVRDFLVAKRKTA
jgi:pimeloyl-ACP methyl ester carboxylesterase